MKNTQIKFTISIAILFLFTQCTKPAKALNTYFYVNEPTSQNKLLLYVDGTYKGELPFIYTDVTMSDDSVKYKALCIPVAAKRYKVEARSNRGVVIVSAEIDLQCNTTISECTGQVGVSKSPDIVIVDFSSVIKQTE